MLVVDLGCGSSGLVQESVFALCPDVARLFCIDTSQQMLKVAATRTRLHMVQFVLAAAENLDRHVPAGIDRVLCNSAICHFDLALAFAAVRRSLAANGEFLFDVAEWDLDECADLSRHPKYDAIDAELAERGLPKKPSRGSRHKITEATLRELLQANRLTPTEFTKMKTAVTAWDYELFYQIPAIVRRSLPHLPVMLAADVLAAATRRLRNVVLPPLRWVIVKAILTP